MSSEKVADLEQGAMKSTQMAKSYGSQIANPAPAEKVAEGAMESTQMVKNYGSQIANPAPAAVFSFAATTFLLALYNVGTRGVHTPNVVVGMAIFAGGLLQFIAGMWEFPRGNVFGATVFSCYGSFWMSYAAIFIPGTGIMAAYSDPQELANAIGLYLIIWFMFTTMLIPCVIRKNLALTLLLTALAVAFALLAAGEFMNKSNLINGGGVMGIITGIIAYYIGMSELLAAEANPIVRLPQGIW